MGKKRKNDSDSSEEDDKKKKKDSKKKKDKSKKKGKKDKSKKKKAKKESSSSSSSSGDAKKNAEEGGVVPADMLTALEAMSKEKDSMELPPPEEGIKRFEFTEKEAGPLGLRFSGGSPPLILAVKPDTHAARKKVPENHEVHAVNGLALVPDNQEKVMGGLKSRPVILDVRPVGWVPSEKRREREKKKMLEEAEKRSRIEEEERRREQVAQDAQEQREREQAERAQRQELDRQEAEVLRKKAMEQKAKQRAKEEAFIATLNSEPEPLRKAAAQLMEAAYGSPVQLEGTGRGRGLPLRVFTRRKEVAWLWAGEAQELIGGGVPDPFSPTE